MTQIFFLDFSAKIINLFYECRFIVQLKIDDNGLTKVFIPEIPEGLKIPIGNCFPHPKVKKNVSHNEVIFCDNYSELWFYNFLFLDKQKFPNHFRRFAHVFQMSHQRSNGQKCPNESPFYISLFSIYFRYLMPGMIHSQKVSNKHAKRSSQELQKQDQLQGRHAYLMYHVCVLDIFQIAKN